MAWLALVILDDMRLVVDIKSLEMTHSVTSDARVSVSLEGVVLQRVDGGRERALPSGIEAIDTEVVE